MHNLIESAALLKILKKPFLHNTELNVNACEFMPRVKILAKEQLQQPEPVQEVKQPEPVPEVQQTKPMPVVQQPPQPLQPYPPGLRYVKPKMKLSWRNRNKPYRGLGLNATTTFKTANKEKFKFLHSEDRIRCARKKIADSGATKKATVKRELKNKILLKKPKKFEIDEKRLEHDRKVALEALKLVEQRRQRDALFPEDLNAAPVVHISRSPVRFSPVEREKVDRLRNMKRERIERVLRDMNREAEREKRILAEKTSILYKEPPKWQASHSPTLPQRFISEHTKYSNTERYLHTNRYVCLQRAQPKKETSPEPEAVPKPSVPTAERPKRYIPTNKEWDDQRRLKTMTKLEDNTASAVDKENSPVKLQQTIQYHDKTELNAEALKSLDPSLIRCIENLQLCPRLTDSEHKFKEIMSTALEENNFTFSFNKRYPNMQRYEKEDLLSMQPMSEDLQFLKKAEELLRQFDLLRF